MKWNQDRYHFPFNKLVTERRSDCSHGYTRPSPEIEIYIIDRTTDNCMTFSVSFVSASAQFSLWYVMQFFFLFWTFFKREQIWSLVMAEWLVLDQLSHRLKKKSGENIRNELFGSKIWRVFKLSKEHNHTRWDTYLYGFSSEDITQKIWCEVAKTQAEISNHIGLGYQRMDLGLSRVAKIWMKSPKEEHHTKVSPNF